MSEKTVYPHAISNIVISFPDDGDIFKIDPILRREYQTLTFQIITSHPLIDVSWIVNDSIIGTVSEPFKITWHLIPGKHKIRACGLTNDKKQILSTPISILVLE